MTVFDNPATVPAPPGNRYSHVARIDLGDKTMLMLSGQIALDGHGDIVGANDMTAQADFIMDNITAILAAHGASLTDVINIRTYVTDMSRLAEYGTARRARFPDSAPKPTSTTVEVSRLFIPGALLEIEALAVTRNRAA